MAPTAAAAAPLFMNLLRLAFFESMDLSLEESDRTKCMRCPQPSQFNIEDTMNQTDSVFQRAVSKLLTEIFDGPPGGECYIVNPGDPGLLRQLESISAATASKQSIPGKSSIAAHVHHLHFGMSVLVRWLSGEENP